VLRLRERARKINMDGELRHDEPLSSHTTFATGGPADLFARPRHAGDIAILLRWATGHGVPWFVLGGGSNVLVADAGVRGLVIDTTAMDERSIEGSTLTVGAGTPVSDASALAADHGLAGLDFIYAMPGSTGGAVWMNARCYGGEIFDVLRSVDLVDPDGTRSTYAPRADDFGYKRSPFMKRAAVMTSVSFRLRPGEPDRLWEQMRAHEADRRAKGHFAAPCAGSVFKNNRAFGRPSGAIIDSLGLRGFSIGRAKVSDLHANIVVNAGGATSAEIRAVIEHVHGEVQKRLGFDLEREVLFVGDWRAHEQP
jgi:UDP-N-acetylmuramate dehydrogenase